MATAYDAVVQEASSAGIPLKYLAPLIDNESGGNPFAVGDQGTSFGLFQLHWGGAGTVNGVNLPPSLLEDPTSPTDVNQIGRLAGAYKNLISQGDPTPQQIFQAEAAVQAPADQTAYTSALLGIYNSSPNHGITAFQNVASGVSIADIENNTPPKGITSAPAATGSSGGAPLPIIGGIGDAASGIGGALGGIGSGIGSGIQLTANAVKWVAIIFAVLLVIILIKR